MAVQFDVNGTYCTVTDGTPRDTSLATYLRNVLGLSGTKTMCKEGGCGVCIVSVRAKRWPSGVEETFAVNSCLVLVHSCHEWAITTIEGLGNRATGYNEIQKRIVAFNGTQCGYCTPGWVMALHSLLNNKQPNNTRTMAGLETSFGSNTCRCTGFRPILDTIKSFAIDASQKLCQQVKDIEDLKICDQTNNACKRKCSIKSDGSDWSYIDELQNATVLNFELNKVFVKVYTEEQIFNVWNRNGTDSYMLIDGNTAKGIEEIFEYPQFVIDISSVKSLKQYYFDQNLVLGANISLEDCIVIFKDIAAAKFDYFAYLEKIAKHFEMIAHIAIRNIGSVAGNLMLKRKIPDFQSDVYILFAAVGAMITVRSSDGQLKILTMTEFLNYSIKRVLIISVLLPPLSKSHIFRSYKIAPRNQNALATVNAAFLLKLNEKTKFIERASIVFGNISPNFIHAIQTEKFLKGKCIFNDVTLHATIKILNNEIIPEVRPPKPSPECRKKLSIGIFYKFILSISPPGLISDRLRSGGTIISRPVSHGTQDFQTDKSLYPLNQPLPKYEGSIQSSGEAIYANDMPSLPNEVFGAFVQSTIFSGEIDYIETLDIPGVIAVFTAKDIPGKNSFIVPKKLTLLTEDEEILSSKQIKYYGQPVAIVVAETEVLANYAAKRVKVTYKNVSKLPPVININQAKKYRDRILPQPTKIEPKGRGTNVKKIIKGIYEIQGQYHYYLEPITTVVVPVDQSLEVYDSTQWTELSQAAIAQSLNMNESDVIVKVRRLGGGFGGKITSNIKVTTACALVAKKLDRPCRFILPIQTNMTISGKRLPSQCEYEVGIDNDGKIQYLNASIKEDKGSSMNDNIIFLTIEGFKNCYNTDYFSLKTALVKTDMPSNTFMRAPGNVEGIASIEHIMEHIAFTVQKDIDYVRKVNMRSENNDIPTLVEQLKIDSNFIQRAKDIEKFNKANRWMKKSIQTSVMAFSLAYPGLFTAIVSVYRVDGTVTVATGGIEMGQGLKTKARQVCAYELNIPVESVSVIQNYTFTAPNNFNTAGSLSSESVCFAIIKACDILKERLVPVKEKMPHATWKDLVLAASLEDISLISSYSMNKKEPDLESYYTYGVAIIETQLDVLTGTFQILRADVLEDVGLSANPSVDVGQVEGAFVQGLGYYTTEKLIYDQRTGKLLTNRSLNYHVPLAQDIPIDFKVHLRYNSINRKGVLGSKAVGEMGVCTAYGITHALRKCIYESRKDSGYDVTEWINIDIPYTKESILKALDIKLDEMLFTI